MGENCSGCGWDHTFVAEKDRILPENLEELAHSVSKYVRGCLSR